MSKTIPTLLAVIVCAAILYPAAAQSTSTIGGVFDYGKAKKVVKTSTTSGSPEKSYLCRHI